jgi:hypothetical protein
VNLLLRTCAPHIALEKFPPKAVVDYVLTPYAFALLILEDHFGLVLHPHAPINSSHMATALDILKKSNKFGWEMHQDTEGDGEEDWHGLVQQVWRDLHPPPPPPPVSQPVVKTESDDITAQKVLSGNMSSFKVIRENDGTEVWVLDEDE